MAGDYTSTFRGRGVEFAEVREYLPGDDVRSIDWNVTARLGEPYRKKFVEEREVTLLAIPLANPEGARLAFGKAYESVPSVDKAKVVLSLDSDFLCSGPSSLRHARAFASRRRVEGGQNTLNRLYAVESDPSNTGTRADHRLPLKASEIEAVARAVAAPLRPRRGFGVRFRPRA